MRCHSGRHTTKGGTSHEVKKDNIRDYAVEAFRYFSTLHCAPTKEAVRFALQKHYLMQGGKNAARNLPEADLKDLYAVVDTIDAIRTLENGAEILETLQNVYLTNPSTNIKRGEIENRILYTTFKTHISTATAYRYLALCRRMFAEARGLRCAYTYQEEERRIV